MHAARTPIGVFTFDETGTMVSWQRFDTAPETALKLFEHGVPDEDARAYAFVRPRQREYALQHFTNRAEFNTFMTRFGILFSKQRMKVAIGRDKLLVQASNALDDLIRIQNAITERLREWYSLHYPEFKDNDPEPNILAYGMREQVPGYTDSSGVDLAESDLAALKDYATFLRTLKTERKALERYIQTTARELCPNTSTVVDPLMAAKLIALAGSIERLARLSSSAIQLLGAEKALFRHLKKQGKSPKFGIIFADPRIQNADIDRRGKVARVLASKIMLAARIDFYSGRDDKENLTKNLNEELEKI